MSDLPRRPRQHELADQGARITQSVLPVGWVYRDLEGKGDYGIDAEVEIFEDGLPTGWSFRLQLKAHERCAWTAADSYVEPVKDNTRNYWRLHPLPVILVACDVGLREAYWAFVDEAETEGGVRVRRSNQLPETSRALRNGVRARLNQTGPISAMLAVPLLEQHWLSLRDVTGHDPFLPVDEDALQPLKWIYGQLPQLRYALALFPHSLVPWEVWVAKSQMTFSPYEELHCAVFDEILAYLTPIVDGTLTAAATRLSADPEQWQDVQAVTWALKRLSRPLSYAPPRVVFPLREFWQWFDSHLESLHVRRFSAAAAFDHWMAQRKKTP
jgi:hypothetical protein